MLQDKIKEIYLAFSRYPLIVYLMRRAGTILPLVLLVIAIVVVRGLLIEYTYDEVVSNVSQIPKTHLFFAFILCGINYFVLTFYDYLGTRYVHATIPLRKVAITSFIAYAFSQNLGASILSGGAIRYRFYQKEGMRASDIAKVIGFTIFHFWLGLFFLTGVLSLLLPETFADIFHLSQSLCRIIGAAVLFPSAVYISFLFFPQVIARKYRRLLPSRLLGLSGLLVCVADWFLAACIFYLTLFGEHEITLLSTIAAFLGAQVTGVMSHIPGGLGVFEATIAFLLSPRHDNAELISSLIVFRLIYYFIPFLIAVILLSLSEAIYQARNISKRISLTAKFDFLENIFLASSPLINSLFCIFTGVLLVLASSFPAEFSEPVFFTLPIPLTAFESSHFFGSIFGVILIFIGVGLRRRIRETWRIALVILTLTIPISLVRGGAFEFLFLLSNIIFLYFTRSSFYRAGAFVNSFARERWIWSLGIVAISGIIGFFSFQDLPYSHNLWLQFSFDAPFPRFLRSIAGMFFGLVTCGSYFAFAKPRGPESSFPNDAELSEASQIMLSAPTTMGFLSLSGDKEILFSEKRDAFLMWQQSGSSIVCLSDPQGSSEAYSELCWRFREIAEETSKLCVFYEISSALIPSVMDLGLRLFKVGEEGIVDLKTFSISGTKSGSFRSVLNKMAKEGLTFRIMEKQEVAARIGELKKVSDEWLSEKSTSEKGFSLGFFDEKYLINFRCAVIENSGNIRAFANIFESNLKSELSIDLMRHMNDLPNGAMDFLFLNLFLWGQKNDYVTFSLGMAPLSGLADNPLAPNYAKLGNLVYRHGGHFYHFEGLRKYKDKFHPTWHPRYIACPSGLYLPVVLSNISVLISGGLKGLVKR